MFSKAILSLYSDKIYQPNFLGSGLLLLLLEQYSEASFLAKAFSAKEI
jgi:hypothetical protein